MKSQSADVTYEELLEQAGHNLIRHEDGTIDIFQMDAGYHNGPGCSICGESWCQHCRDEIKPCPGPAKRLECEAEQRMRDAAPELLEACKKARSCASIPDYVQDLLRAAIAKAEGNA